MFFVLFPHWIFDLLVNVAEKKEEGMEKKCMEYSQVVQTTWQVENKVTIENVFRLYRMWLQKMLIVKPQDTGVNDLSDNVAICYKNSDLLRLRIEFWAVMIHKL